MEGIINPLNLQGRVAEKYKYKKLADPLSEKLRKVYKMALPGELDINGNSFYHIYSKAGTLIATGYERIVIGDYGAFIEFNRDQAVKPNICCKKGQEYRYKQESFRNRVKYYWYTAKDDSDIKIYFQQRPVVYADYKPGMLYVSPHEIQLNGGNNEKGKSPV